MVRTKDFLTRFQENLNAENSKYEDSPWWEGEGQDDTWYLSLGTDGSKRDL